MKWGHVQYVHTILFEEEKATVAGYCTISGFSRQTDSTRDRVCFTKIFLRGIHKKYFCTRDRALTRDSGSTRDRKSILYSIFLEPQRTYCMIVPSNIVLLGGGIV